jgi:hypothetical protein
VDAVVPDPRELTRIKGPHYSFFFVVRNWPSRGEARRSQTNGIKYANIDKNISTRLVGMEGKFQTYSGRGVVAATSGGVVTTDKSAEPSIAAASSGTGHKYRLTSHGIATNTVNGHSSEQPILTLISRHGPPKRYINVKTITNINIIN